MQNVDQTIDDQESECHAFRVICTTNAEWIFPHWESYECSKRNHKSSGSKQRDLTKCRANQCNDKRVSEIKMHGCPPLEGLDRWQIRGDKLSESFHTAASATIEAANFTNFRSNQLWLWLGVRKNMPEFLSVFKTFVDSKVFYQILKNTQN